MGTSIFRCLLVVSSLLGVSLFSTGAFAKGDNCAAVKTQADCTKKTACAWGGKSCVAKKAAPAKKAAAPAKAAKSSAAPAKGKAKADKPATAKKPAAAPAKKPAAAAKKAAPAKEPAAAEEPMDESAEDMPMDDDTEY